eukprot:TRINITY_DN8093_c0_g1_i1.p1 TRINITY_DN8093_c0_g1~~TRINITY_DN8093_c0_g1_i1.p1  ORF type:complete len:324 (-),score=27.87 TRINITY_DN8093_c0_g1_i1:49-1020(-)
MFTAQLLLGEITAEFARLQTGWKEEEDERLRAVGWGNLKEEHYDVISRYSPLVEIGAGQGYHAEQLRQRYPSVDILCFDNRDLETFLPQWNQASHVQVGTPEILQTDPRCKGRNLLLIWPPTGSMAEEALRLCSGQFCLFVGEPKRGLTGNQKFFEELQSGWTLIHSQPVDSFEESRDSLFIFKRGPGNTRIPELTSADNLLRLSKLHFRRLKKGAMAEVRKGDNLLQAGNNFEALEAFMRALNCIILLRYLLLRDIVAVPREHEQEEILEDLPLTLHNQAATLSQHLGQIRVQMSQTQIQQIASRSWYLRGEQWKSELREDE